jgi:hypothetical protein
MNAIEAARLATEKTKQREVEKQAKIRAFRKQTTKRVINAQMQKTNTSQNQVNQHFCDERYFMRGSTCAKQHIYNTQKVSK